MLLTRTKRSRKKSLAPPGIRLRKGLVIFPAGQRGSDYVYSPYGGRWTRRDPMGIRGGENLYTLLSGNIIDYTDFVGLAGVATFEYNVTYREENHGQSRRFADIDRMAKEASGYTKLHIYEIAKGIQVVVDLSAPLRGKQYRYFIRFKCECDDGCFLFNIGATKPNTRTINFVVTAQSLGVGNDAGNVGFSSLYPIPPEYDSYVEQEIESEVSVARGKCASLCAADSKD